MFTQRGMSDADAWEAAHRYQDARDAGMTAAQAYEVATGRNPLKPGGDVDNSIQNARNAQQNAHDLAERYGYNDDRSRKTVASDGTTNTLSGWKELGENGDFTRVSPQDVIDRSAEINHGLRNAGANDQGIPGQYNASHAEKQLSIISENSIGISQPMCTDCQSYFNRLAQAEGRSIVTADPNVVRIFNPNGSVTTIFSDGSVVMN